MTIPYFLNPASVVNGGVPYDYDQHDGLTDVETGGVGIISDSRTILLALGWTEPSTNLFKSYVDAAGRFMDVLMTRISATNIELRLRNAAGTTVCTRRIQIDNPGSVRYYANIYGLVIESLRANPAEIFQAHVLDQTPDLQTDSSLYVVGNGLRTTADVNDAGGDGVGELFAIDNGSAASASRFRSWSRNTAGTQIGLVTATGRLLFRDAMTEINSAGTKRWAGRICHALLVDSSIGPGAEKSPHVDDQTTGDFRVVGLTASIGMRLAFRRSG